MRKLTKLLIPAVLLVAVVMAFSVMSVSAAEATQLEWTGGTSDEAIAFLDNAMKTAEAGSDVVVTLKADMTIDGYSARTPLYLGTDATTDKVVTINGAANGDTLYGITVNTNAYLNFKGNVTFGNVVLNGTNQWSTGSAIGSPEGKIVLSSGVITGAESAKRLNVYGKNVEIYAGNYRTVAGNFYGSGVTVDTPVITLAGKAYADVVIGRQHDLGGGQKVTGLCTVNIIDEAGAGSATAGSWQASTTAGDGILNMNTTGKVNVVYLAGSAGAKNGDFSNGDAKSNYTFNVLGGQVYTVYLYAAESGTAKNLNVTYNFGDATYNSSIYFGMYEPQTALNKDGTEPNGRKYATAIKDSTAEINITGGTFKSSVYFGSGFLYNASSEPNGSYEDIDRVVNITGNPTFNSSIYGGTYSRHGKHPARGDLVFNIEGGTFKGSVYGGSNLSIETLKVDGVNTYPYGKDGAGIHSGKIEMNISGGTYSSHISGGSYFNGLIADHQGEIKLTINGYIKKTSGRLMGGSIPYAGVHSGDITMILGGSETCSIANQIIGGSYIDNAAAKHTGNTTIIIEGSADWNATIAGGSFVAKNDTTVCPESDPAEIKIIVDKDFEGEVGTIIAGQWYNGSTTQKSVAAANYSVEVNGGLVSSITGHNTSYEGNKTPGTTSIVVNGGTVFGITGYGNIDTGSEISIEVKDTATRVVGVTGYAKEAQIGDSVSVKYDRKVTRDDEIKNFAEGKVTAVGKEEDQPIEFTYTLYVANTSKGKGDGSSPENAIGHDADYYQVRAQALQIIAANGGTNSGLTGDNKTIVGSVYKKNALYKAMTYKGSRILSMGGTIVVCDVLTIDATDAMRKSLADFWAGGISSCASSKPGEVTITSLDPNTGIDYRAKGARLVLDTADLGLCVEFCSPTVLDHLNIEHRYNSKNGKSIDNLAIVAAMGNKFVVGYDVFVWANDINPAEDSRVELFPSLLAGHRYSNSKSDNYITVGSGTWATVVGGDWGSAHTGNATIGIDGSAKIGTVCGTIKSTASGAKNIFDGSVWIGLWGGEVDNVICVAKPGLKWGDASIGLGGTKVNGTIRATHADYSGEEIQAWVFNYTDAQVDTDKVIGFESPVPETGSNVAYYAVIAVVALAGAALLISKKRRCIED